MWEGNLSRTFSHIQWRCLFLPFNHSSWLHKPWLHDFSFIFFASALRIAEYNVTFPPYICYNMYNRYSLEYLFRKYSNLGIHLSWVWKIYFLSCMSWKTVTSYLASCIIVLKQLPKLNSSFYLWIGKTNLCKWKWNWFFFLRT